MIEDVSPDERQVGGQAPEAADHTPQTPARAPQAPQQARRRRSWLEVRWRQFRNPPPPVLRAVLADGAVAAVLGVLYLAYDVAITRGAALPDYRLGAAAGLVLAVVVAGSAITYLIVPQPGRPGTRSGWSAALGFFASLPIAYLALVIATQLLKPLFL